MNWKTKCLYLERLIDKIFTAFQINENGDIVIKANNISLAGENIDIKSEKVLDLTGKTDLNITGNFVDIQSELSMDIQSKDNIDINAIATMTINSEDSININADSSMDIISSDSLNIKSTGSGITIISDDNQSQVFLDNINSTSYMLTYDNLISPRDSTIENNIITDDFTKSSINNDLPIKLEIDTNIGLLVYHFVANDKDVNGTKIYQSAYYSGGSLTQVLISISSDYTVTKL